MLSIALTMTGCVDVGDFNLTESEEKAIVDYATTVMLKHDARHDSRLVDTSMTRELDARIEVIKQLNARGATADSVTDMNSSSSEGDSKDSASAGVALPEGEQDLADAFGIDGFEVTYMGYEVVDRYGAPEGINDIGIEAKAGKQLMVFHYEIDNVSAEERTCNIFDTFPSFKVMVNGSNSLVAENTFLEDDLTNINRTVPAGEGLDGVIIVETDKGYEDSISSLALFVKYGDKQSVVPMEL